MITTVIDEFTYVDNCNPQFTPKFLAWLVTQFISALYLGKF